MTDKELRDLAEKLTRIAHNDPEVKGWFTEIERREARNVAAAIESVLNYPVPELIKIKHYICRVCHEDLAEQMADAPMGHRMYILCSLQHANIFVRLK